MSLATREPTNFEKGAQLLVRLHELIEQGEGEGAQADQVRDRMDEVWAKLDEVKLARLDGLSADLYTLGSDSPIVHPPGPHMLTQQASEFLQHAVLSKDWDAQLEFLRKHADEVGDDLAAYYRGFCWTQLGLREVGMLFLSRAAERDKQFELYRLIPLIEMERLDEAIDLCLLLFDRMCEFDPLRIQIIADACAVIAGRIAPDKKEQFEWIRKSIKAHEFSLEEFPRWSPKIHREYLKSPAARFMYQALSWAYLFVHDIEKARWACDEAMKLAPEDKDLQVLDECIKTAPSNATPSPLVMNLAEASLNRTLVDYHWSYQANFFLPQSA